MTDAMINHRQATLEGSIELHVAELGTGPPVILCHGFPELWYSWRHQLPALAEAGYRALAPDMRGYGHSSIPADPRPTTCYVCGDMVGLLDDIGEERACSSATTGARASCGSSRRPIRTVSARSPASASRSRRARRRLRWACCAGARRGLLHRLVPAAGGRRRSARRDVRRTLTAREQWTAAVVARNDQPPCPPWLTEEDLRRLRRVVRADRLHRRTELLPQHRPDMGATATSASAGSSRRRCSSPARGIPVARFMPASS